MTFGSVQERWLWAIRSKVIADRAVGSAVAWPCNCVVHTTSHHITCDLHVVCSRNTFHSGMETQCNWPDMFSLPSKTAGSWDFVEPPLIYTPPYNLSMLHLWSTMYTWFTVHAISFTTLVTWLIMWPTDVATGQPSPSVEPSYQGKTLEMLAPHQEQSPPTQTFPLAHQTEEQSGYRQVGLNVVVFGWGTPESLGT